MYYCLTDCAATKHFTRHWYHFCFLPQHTCFNSSTELSLPLSIWAQCCMSFSSLVCSASVASLAHGAGGWCHWPCCRFHCAAWQYAAQRPFWWSLKDSSHVPTWRSGRTRWQTNFFSSLTQQEVWICIQTHTHTPLASINLEDRAAEQFYKAAWVNRRLIPLLELIVSELAVCYSFGSYLCLWQLSDKYNHNKVSQRQTLHASNKIHHQ